MLYRDLIKLETEPGKRIDITKDVENVVKKSNIKEGLCNVFFPGTTAGLILNENDIMLMNDFERFFESFSPQNRLYQHAENAYSHIRGSVAKCEVTIPVSNGKLILGEWQNIIFWEFDTRDRSRTIVITISGK
ncbi:YjbQ family protein [Candidatus Woesearchaeota archaeon]|nr:YjbQ family protein [Candidatus Woesearchaeota archaeon]